MYPKFIEVHLAKDDCLASLNVDNIIGLADYNDGEGYIIKTLDRGNWIVDESYDELKALITDVGCLIHKPDPRLDLTNPLTLDDLKDMVGEPVWNSNVDVWMLVKDVSDTWVKMLWTSGNISEYTEDELIAYPVYRMRRA
jgi:hypothetical protein